MTTQNTEYEESIFNRFSKYIRNGVARTIETGREFGVTHGNDILPYAGELKFLKHLSEIQQDIERYSGNLRNPNYIEDYSRILSSLSQFRIPSNEVIQNINRIHNLAWEYQRDIGSASWKAHHIPHSIYGRQEALTQRVRDRNRQNAFTELTRISNINVNQDNLTNLIEQVGLVNEDYLYTADDGLRISRNIRENTLKPYLRYVSK